MSGGKGTIPGLSSSSSSSSASGTNPGFTPKLADDQKTANQHILESLMGIAISNTGVSVVSVISDLNALKDISHDRFVLILVAGVAAAGNIRDNFAMKMNPLYSSLGDVPPSFQGANGGNFKGFSILAHILMSGIAQNGTTNEYLMKVFNHYRTFVPSGRIANFTSNNPETKKDKEREAILLQAKAMFNAETDWVAVCGAWIGVADDATKDLSAAMGLTKYAPIGMYTVRPAKFLNPH